MTGAGSEIGGGGGGGGGPPGFVESGSGAIREETWWRGEAEAMPAGENMASKASRRKNGNSYRALMIATFRERKTKSARRFRARRART